MSERLPMTRAGYDKLEEELRRLKSVERLKIVKEIEVARAHGDISENAEFHAAKERQSHIEGRVRLLEDKLARAVVIDPTGQATGRGPLRGDRPARGHGDRRPGDLHDPRRGGIGRRQRLHLRLLTRRARIVGKSRRRQRHACASPRASAIFEVIEIRFG